MLAGYLHRHPMPAFEADEQAVEGRAACLKRSPSILVLLNRRAGSVWERSVSFVSFWCDAVGFFAGYFIALTGDMDTIFRSPTSGRIIQYLAASLGLIKAR